MVLFLSCDKTNNVFLDKFKNTNDILNPKGSYSELITNEDLVIFQAGLIVNDFVVNTNQKYYYGFKKKLDSNHYLITYCVKYTPLYKPTYQLFNWHDDILCVYDMRNDRIVSKLKIRTSDPVLSKTHVKENIYFVKSLYRRYKYSELDDRAFFEADSLLNKYKIENNEFVEVK